MEGSPDGPYVDGPPPHYAQNINNTKPSIFENQDCAAQTSVGPTIIFIVRGIYGCLSILAYGINVAAIRRSKMCFTLFLLYSTAAFMSSVYFLEYWGFMQFIDLGHACLFFWLWLSDPNYILTTTRAVATYCPISILILNYLISLHRMTTIIFPLKAKMWDKNISFILFVALLLPLGFMWHIIPCQGYVVNDPIGGLDAQYEYRFEGMFCNSSTTLSVVIAASFFGTLTFINTIFTLVMLKRRPIMIVDFGMVYFQILLAAVTFLYVATQIVVYILRYFVVNDELEYFIEHVSAFVVDVFILPQAWSLLIFSRTVRNGAWKILSPSSPKISVSQRSPIQVPPATKRVTHSR